MIKFEAFIIVLVATLVVAGGYMARGYWAVGPELLIVPTMILVAHLVNEDIAEQRGKMR